MLLFYDDSEVLVCCVNYSVNSLLWYSRIAYWLILTEAGQGDDHAPNGFGFFLCQLVFGKPFKELRQ